MIYDVIIIGLGVAGYSAGIYSKRAGLKTLVLEGSMPGGLLNYINTVNNYPGFINISGPDLNMKMYEHFLSFDIDYKNENVINIEDGDIKKVCTNTNEYLTKNIIISTGRTRRTLGIENEDSLYGKGLSWCAICDGHFYKGKSVGVVGSGDSSMEEALYLSNLAKDVTIIVRGNTLKGKNDLIESVNNKDNIKIIYNASIKKLNEKGNKLNSVILSNNEEIFIEGLFIYIGFEPVLPFCNNLNIKKENGYILTNNNFETNLKGIYACGDIIKKDLYQIISAEYEGATAASHIAKILTNKIDK